MAIAALIAVDAYLRPSELQSLTVESLAPLTAEFETSSWTSFQAWGTSLPAHVLQASQRMNSSCGMENMEMSFDRRCKEVSEERFVVRRLREYVSPLRVLRSRPVSYTHLTLPTILLV